jgi:nucleoside-diphosphate-sugar epimerase
MVQHKVPEITRQPDVIVYQADLARLETLYHPCQGTDCIVHFAGRLFAPRPARFLRETNVVYVQNLVRAAIEMGVSKFILVSFPHVEGESSPENLARGVLAGSPASIHARTRLLAEQDLFTACDGTTMVPVALRPGLIYAQGVLMIEAARRLMRRRLLGVWRKDTWMHLISLPDFLEAVQAAIENKHIEGIYNLGDDQPLTLQAFLDRLAGHWGTARPWRAPGWVFYLAASLVEAYALTFKTTAPLTRDFIWIGGFLLHGYQPHESWADSQLLSDP